MTTAPRPLTRTRIDPDASDDELVLATRAGDSRAYGVLWGRHAPAANRAARAITSSIDPEDLVSEAFAKTFSAIRNGGGPTDAFRPYLFAAVRSAAATWGGKQKDIPLEYIDDLPADDAEDSLDLLSDKSLLSTAFKDLPERWRTLLWYLEVEGMKPREIAPLMGMTPNAVSVLAARAREGFKVAWLHAHINEPGRDEECRWACERIVAQERKRHVSRADGRRFDAHLEGCRRCTMASAEVAQASSKLRALLLPALLGGPAAAAYSAGTPAPAGAAVSPFGTAAGWGVVVGGAILVGTLAVGAVAVIAELGSQGAPGVDDASALVVESPAPIITPATEPVPIADPSPTIEPAPILPPPVPEPEHPLSRDPLSDLLTVPELPSIPVRPSIPPAPESTDPAAPKPLDRAVTIAWEITDASAVPPAITGTATPGGRIEILDEGGAVIATTTADGSGAFSLHLDPDSLRQGMSISARQTSPTTGVQTTSDTVGPVDFAVPTVVDSGANNSRRVDADGDGAEDDVELTLQGIEGETVSITIDGVPSTEVMLTEGATIVAVLDVRLGSRDVVVRYVDPATGDLGLAVPQRIVVVP